MDSNLSCFYAQIRALFQDEHVNAFAFLTWLLPTSLKSSTNNFQFDPTAYSIGKSLFTLLAFLIILIIV